MAIIHKFPAPLPLRQRAMEEAEAQALLTVNAVNRIPVSTDSESREAHRKDMLAKIHMAKAKLLATKPGYTEDIYRATLEDLYGVTSAADLTPTQMHNLLLHFARLGWQKQPRKARAKDSPAAYVRDISGLDREGLLAKIKAMLEEKARVEGTDVPWAYAVGVLKRQSGGITKSLDQATREQLSAIIVALWRDARRKGRRCR